MVRVEELHQARKLVELRSLGERRLSALRSGEAISVS